jgi:Raf kinase inhibitor-like YbhB/YbcL family protein
MRRLLPWLVLLLVPVMAFGAQGFSLTSRTLQDGGSMPIQGVYTECGGGNISPELMWHDPPKGTRSYAVTMFDPDANGGFWHWVMFDISVGAQGLNAGAGTPFSGDAPGDAVGLRNDFGNLGYSGPCPPPGPPHHYIITVFALDVPRLDFLAHFDRGAALAQIRQHTIAKATLTVTWGR